MALAVAMVASGSVTVSVGAAQQATGAEDHVLRLKSRRIDPGPGVDIRSIERAAGPNGRVHFFLQVHILPDATEKRRYAAEGIDLLNYVTGNTYIASAPVASVRNLRNLPGVRWAAPIDADDKITADTKASQVGDWARDRRGQVVLDITVHPDVALGEAEALVARYGGALLASIPAIPAVTAAFNPGQAGRIVGEDIVQYVDAVSPPLGDHNNGAVPAINAVPLATTPYNLDGTGVTVLVFDSGRIDNGHPDFGTRILTADGSGIRLHSTHVGGTVGGSGANSNGNDSAGAPNGGTANQWAGVAPGVNLRSFGSDGDGDMYNDAGQINGDFATAINQGIDIATMSQGNNVVGNGLPCGQLGDYTGTALLMDNIVRGSLSGQQLIFTQSAGNERGTPPGRTTCGMGFSTISSPGTAKNPIVVGAINSNDNSMTNFSSHGPTDDGRLKPDIVGPGCQSNGDGGITSTGFDDLDPPGDGRPNGDLDAGEVRNAYVSMCGTSMSTPAVAGALALVTEQWRSTRPARPLGHTAKAISIHTATDLGNIGPDYQFGWGAFNARAAVDLVRADDTADLIQVEQVDNGQTDTYTFNSDGSAPVRVTLVWSDPAATQLAATALVNNVDLRLVDPDGVESQPLVLDAAQPGNAASAGNDTANNVEMVVAGAKAGTWEVRVVGTAVPTGPQQYTLVTPTDSALNRRPVANAGGPYNSAEGTDVVLNGGASTDADGNTLTHEWDFDNDGQFDDATGPGPSFGLVGQDGVLPVRLRVTDTEGAFSVGQSQVTVTNVAPGFAVLASNAPRDENTEVTLIGTATDPGWLDGLTVTVDWNDGSPVQTLAGPDITGQENVRPDATPDFTVRHLYGDNGGFSARVCTADDDTSTCQSLPLAFANVNPTAAIGTAGTTLINGAPTFLSSAGAPLTFSGRSTDPGSDDLSLSWDFDDGTPVVTTLYLLNPPTPDPALSPSQQPRDVTDGQTHSFASACFYEIGLRAVDDDEGTSPRAGANVIIVGTDSQTRSAGFWTQQYRGGASVKFDAQTLDCYLAMAGYMSRVFDEVRDAATQAKARDVLQVNENSGTATQLFDRQLMAAWLNFANGSVRYTELVDTDGKGGPDTPFDVVMAAAESVRLNPVAPAAQIEQQKDVLERINLRHGG